MRTASSNPYASSFQPNVIRTVAVKGVALASLLLLAGCSVLEGSATGQAIAILDPRSGQASAEQAQRIAFASLALNTDTQRGLAVMGAQTGAQTHWPIAGGGFLSLYHGGLFAASTPQGDLLTTRYHLDGVVDDANISVPWQHPTPASFAIERHWVDSEGLSYTQRGEGRMACGTPERREMLLTTLPLQPCDVSYRWESGQTTRAQWWREPTTLMLWEVEEPAWPDGPDISWQVARPWWNS